VRSLVIGTAGHIDHGKSALVKALTGIDPDRLKEEQARGITIDLGFAHATIDDVTVAFVDVPGHERFVRNMLAGAGGLDAVLLVIAADESVMPQTREHFAICRLLGITRGLIVLTKSDLVDADTIELAALEARELVAGSVFANAGVIAVSARTGDGLDSLRRALVGLADGVTRQERAGVTRVPVDRVFTVKGFGTVVTGTLVSGVLAEGVMLEVLPGSRAARVRGLQVHGRTVSSVQAPGRVAVNLGSVGMADLGRGITLASPGTLSVTSRVDARIELLADAPPLRHGARVRVHQGTSELGARVAVASRRNADTPWIAARPGEAVVVVPAGGHGLVRLRFDHPAVATRGDRVVLRASSPAVTIGGGVVLDAEPPVAGLRREGSQRRFDALCAPDESFVALWIAEARERGVTAADLVRRGGLSPVDADAALDRRVAAGSALFVGESCVDRAVVDDLARRLLQALTAFHRAAPLEPGLSRDALRDQSAPRASIALFAYLVDRLTTAGSISGADRLAMSSHQPSRSAEDTRTYHHVDRILGEAGLTPPDRAELAHAAGVDADAIERAIHALVKAGLAIKAGPLVFPASALERLKREIAALKQESPPASPARVDVAAFKRRFGLSRKYAIPLLEWLDRERITRRLGDVRIVL
jgi:selenocysteine-specific elongation factor